MEQENLKERMINRLNEDIHGYVIGVMRAIANQDINEEMFLKGCLDSARESLRLITSGEAFRTFTIE